MLASIPVMVACPWHPCKGDPHKASWATVATTRPVSFYNRSACSALRAGFV